MAIIYCTSRSNTSRSWAGVRDRLPPSTISALAIVDGELRQEDAPIAEADEVTVIGGSDAEEQIAEELVVAAPEVETESSAPIDPIILAIVALMTGIGVSALWLVLAGRRH